MGIRGSRQGSHSEQGAPDLRLRPSFATELQIAMKLTLHIWRQKNSAQPGKMVPYTVEANEHMSFLEMLDVLNETLTMKGEDPVAFDHDCREGICGSCGFVINGIA